ncbi:MAG: hypothetical protein IKR08_02200 [Firmicutes bacterium]|nr:hypothetical protein [Bacillota bacterium]
MEEKRPDELNDESLDSVNGGGSYLIPDENPYSQIGMNGQVRCGNCRRIVRPRFSRAMNEYTCPNCGEIL